MQTGRQAGKCFKAETRWKERNKHSEVKENRCDGFRKSVLQDENFSVFLHTVLCCIQEMSVIAYTRRVHINVTTVVFSRRKLKQAQLSKFEACPLIADAN